MANTPIPNHEEDSVLSPYYDDSLELPPPRKGVWALIKNDPVPSIGAAITAGVLCVGFGTMLSGNSYRGQMLMRARVAAQAFTVGAICVSGAWKARQKLVKQ